MNQFALRLLRILAGNWLRRLGTSILLAGVTNLILGGLLEEYIIVAVAERLLDKDIPYVPGQPFFFSAILIGVGLAILSISYVLERRLEHPRLQLRTQRNYVSLDEETLNRETPTAQIGIEIKVMSRSMPVSIRKLEVQRRSANMTWLLREISGVAYPANSSEHLDFSSPMSASFNNEVSIGAESVTTLKMIAKFLPPLEISGDPTQGHGREGGITNRDSEMTITLHYALPNIDAKAIWNVTHNPRSGTYEINSQSLRRLA